LQKKILATSLRFGPKTKRLPRCRAVPKRSAATFLLVCRSFGVSFCWVPFLFAVSVYNCWRASFVLSVPFISIYFFSLFRFLCCRWDAAAPFHVLFIRLIVGGLLVCPVSFLFLALLERFAPKMKNSLAPTYLLFQPHLDPW